MDASALKLEAALPELVLLDCRGGEIVHGALDVGRHFLAEGFGKVFKIDLKTTIHRNTLTTCRPATHLVDPGGVVTESLLHSEASHYVADIACSDELHIEEDSRNFFAIILHDHGVLIHSGQS